ncbi:MAG: Gp138 family membrane-puncturing spike protein [Rhodospirillaceae bacterium]|nr:Gp138 family membrane-puncturing spike protein [Rhodospirillaceae bacterium]
MIGGHLTVSMDRILTAFAASLRTVMPGMVESWDAATNRAVVSLSLQVPSAESAAELLDRPLLSDVPMIFPGSQQVSLVWRVRRGDQVLVLWSKHGLEAWKKSAFGRARQGGLFAASGAVALPWTAPAGQLPDGYEWAMVRRNGTAFGSVDDPRGNRGVSFYGSMRWKEGVGDRVPFLILPRP